MRVDVSWRVSERFRGFGGQGLLVSDLGVEGVPCFRHLKKKPQVLSAGETLQLRWLGGVRPSSLDPGSLHIVLRVFVEGKFFHESSCTHGSSSRHVKACTVKAPGQTPWSPLSHKHYPLQTPRALACVACTVKVVRAASL